MSRRKRATFGGEQSEEGAELFAVPGNFLTRQGRELVKAARDQYEERRYRNRRAPLLPVEQLRRILRELAPDVRDAVQDVRLMPETVYSNEGVEYDELIRADVPPVVAHFAFVALALVEAEAEERLRTLL